MNPINITSNIPRNSLQVMVVNQVLKPITFHVYDIIDAPMVRQLNNPYMEILSQLRKIIIN